MKCKLLLNSRCYSKHHLFGVVLSSFLCVSAWAIDKNPSEIAKGFDVNERTESISSNLAVQQSVSGTVLDENGVPLPGVSVFEKGTTNGVATDFDGNYTLTLSASNSVLVFSYVGYTTKEEVVGSRTAIDIAMEPDQQQLEQVVVVGYGTKKKSEVTNAVVQTSGEEIKKSVAPSLSNSLAGRLPGLSVNQQSSAPGFDDATILVRGFNTYRNNGALIVIDGVASADPDGLNRLDPNDIESVSVLKDASAAIYGSQSAGGVILVTTKRGKKGKTSVNFTSTQAFDFPTFKVKTANALEYMSILNSSRVLDGTDLDYPQELIDKYTSGELRSEDWHNALIDAPASQSRQSLTLRGGNDNVRYFASLGALSQGGILRGDNKTKLRQYNVRSNLDISVTKNLEVGIDLSYRQKLTNTPQMNPGGDLFYVATYSPLRVAYIDNNYDLPAEGWSHSNPAARLLSPGYRKFDAQISSGTFRYKYDIPVIEGLSLEGFASVVKNTNYEKAFNYTWFFYEKDGDGNIVKVPSRTIEDIGLAEYFGRDSRVTVNTKLNYNTTIAEDHNISAFVAFEQMEFKFNEFQASRLGYDSPLIDQLFAGSTNRNNWGNDGTARENARQNYFGRLTYDYQGKYLFGYNFRYDGSTIFPKESRWGFFQGVSAGWVLSKEAFMPDVFSNLKLRGSWGQMGNDRVDPFQYLAAFGFDQGYVVDGNDVQGLAPTTTPNPNITWEVSETTNLGLEVGVLNNRLTFELDVFKTTTKDILARRQASIPQYTGLSLPDENIGKMENKGFEFQTSYRQNFGDDLVFKASGNISYSKNKVIYFDEAPQSEEYQKREGRTISSNLVYKAIGIYRTQEDLDNNVNYVGAGLGDLIFADLNGDGEINGNDRYRFDTSVARDNTGRVIAQGIPTTQFGLSLGLDYKDFDFSVLFQGQAGAKWRLDNGFSPDANGNGLAYVANNSYTVDNINAELPRIRPTGTGAQNSDFWYHDSNFVRLKSFELGYTLPQKPLSAVGITNLRLYVSGQNLFMVYNSLKKFGAGDPEFLSGKGAYYPNMRTLNLGLNLTF
ncbi:SusC/RagA family TonB-linked outer membrane protein [Snuella sedimenti]|uniref:TonB-dependent receptor n=1 Tax=Snuella sedimenti TaxID=2798802 RepID=A0A8J7J0S7_9FLAO|nr:TonB-dependent receptor [Snuella sedimenti]MBJ6367462.1 TonB-dependent receptor [Snuella sedimenti]